MSNIINAVDFNNVSFSYGGGKVIEQASFKVPAYSFMSIVGPNGGGKTTLLKIMLGLLSPQSGETRILGSTPRNARPAIGYMPQHMDFDPKFPISVKEVVLMGCSARHMLGWYSRRDALAADQAIDEVGLTGLQSTPFANLSGGQRQRVLIARAIVSRPGLLLLDEPTSNIDIESEARLRDILLSLNRHMTILMVSHDLGFVADFIKTVICVNRRVFVHPTCELTGDMIHGIYADEMRVVRHDFHHKHDCETRLSADADSTP